MKRIASLAPTELVCAYRKLEAENQGLCYRCLDLEADREAERHAIPVWLCCPCCGKPCLAKLTSPLYVASYTRRCNG